MIIFKTPGSLDIRCLTNFGVSVKENDNPIGYFGTGLKYAIAVLMRERAKVWISIEGNLYQVQTKEESIRNKQFTFVYLSGQYTNIDLGFTTELGKNWELWMAYRELYSNTLDEGGSVSRAYNKSIISWKENEDIADDTTYIVVSSQAFTNVYLERDKYFLDECIPIGQEQDLQIYPGRTTTLYYKGIAAMELPAPAQFRYSLSSPVLKLTEDRTLYSDFSVKLQIITAMLRSNNKVVLKKILRDDDSIWERELCWTYCATVEPSPTWLEVVKELREETTDQGVNPSAILRYNETIDYNPLEEIKEEVLTGINLRILEKATDFCRDTLELPNFDSYPIKVVTNVGENTLGRAWNNTIYVAMKAIAQGTKVTAITIIEEYIHLHHDVSDGSVSQQWEYLQLIASLGERLQGEPL